MGASAHVLALVRSHYSGDERAFMDHRSWYLRRALANPKR